MIRLQIPSSHVHYDKFLRFVLIIAVMYDVRNHHRVRTAGPESDPCLWSGSTAYLHLHAEF
jgi:hypothetical protein